MDDIVRILSRILVEGTVDQHDAHGGFPKTKAVIKIMAEGVKLPPPS